MSNMRGRHGVNQNNQQSGEAELLAAENNALFADLLGATRELKHLSIDINKHIKDDNENLLEDFDSTFNKAQSAMRSTMNRLKKMMDQPGSNYMIYIAIFIIALFIMLWFAIRILG